MVQTTGGPISRATYPVREREDSATLPLQTEEPHRDNGCQRGNPSRFTLFLVTAPGARGFFEDVASKPLTEAARRLPSNGEVLTLAAISRIPGCCEGSDAGTRILEIQRMLERADALEQGNLKIARNLLNWYGYLATVPDEKLPFTRVELLERTRQATNSLAAWDSRGSP